MYNDDIWLLYNMYMDDISVDNFRTSGIGDLLNKSQEFLNHPGCSFPFWERGGFIPLLLFYSEGWLVYTCWFARLCLHAFSEPLETFG